jgi:hypothetical protein
MKYLALFEGFNNVDEVKDIIIQKALNTLNIDVIDFFVKRNYDFDNVTTLLEMCFDPKLFKYFIDKGFDVEKYKDNLDFKRIMRELNVQKLLIDFGFEDLIWSTVGFNRGLEYDSKYSDIIKREKDMNKYNL